MPTLLVLQADPLEETALRLQKEVRAIKERLRAGGMTHWKVESEGAVTRHDLQPLLMRNRPDVVHFCGHSTKAGELLLEDDNGNGQPMDSGAVADIFRRCGEGIKCVVLNSCYSSKQAIAIARSVPCVIGMASEVSDEAALTFATTFYQGLGFSKSIGASFELGKLGVALISSAERDIPRLHTRRGFVPDEIIFEDHRPEIAVKFLLGKGGKPVKNRWGYELQIAIRNPPPGTQSVVFQYNDESIALDEQFEELYDTGQGFETVCSFYGDFQIRATIWDPPNGIGISVHLGKALELAHPKPRSVPIQKAIDDINNN